MPKHIHVEKAEKTAKFNIEFVELVKSYRFNTNELRIIRNLIEKNQYQIKNIK